MCSTQKPCALFNFFCSSTFSASSNCIVSSWSFSSCFIHFRCSLSLSFLELISGLRVRTTRRVCEMMEKVADTLHSNVQRWIAGIAPISYQPIFIDWWTQRHAALSDDWRNPNTDESKYVYCVNESRGCCLFNAYDYICMSFFMLREESSTNASREVCEAYKRARKIHIWMNSGYAKRRVREVVCRLFFTMAHIILTISGKRENGKIGEREKMLGVLWMFRIRMQATSAGNLLGRFQR